MSLRRRGAGAGKTTFLQALCAETARGDGTITGRPFWYGEAGSVLGGGSDEGLRRLLPSDGYVLLDGFDRIEPEAARIGAVRTLEAMMAAQPEARFIVASRPSALSSAWLDDRFLEVRLCALSRAERARLVERCFASSDGSGTIGAEADAVEERLTGGVRDPRRRFVGAQPARRPRPVRARPTRRHAARLGARVDGGLLGSD